MNEAKPVKVGVLTISDRCSEGVVEDISGATVNDNLVRIFATEWSSVILRECVPDDVKKISEILKKWSDELEINFIITTGGTGLAARDVTPEATKMVIDKEAPGIATAILTESLKITPLAMLSRLVCGIRKNTLIVNFPGSPKACDQCFCTIEPVVKHAIDVLRNNREANELHTKIIEKAEPVFSKVTIDKIARRNRKSPYPMILVKEAQEIILKAVVQLEPIVIKTTDALGYVTNSYITARDPFPPFRASIKDGYAVISEDGIGTRLVKSSLLAGSDKISDYCLKPGECMRITTGAPIPNGADAVVQVEDTELFEEDEDGAEVVILLRKHPNPKENIREVGSDIPENYIIIESGTLLTSAKLGVLATGRIKKVQVIRKPKIAVLSTGNELQSFDAPYQPGKIVDSNKITLMSLLAENGFSATDCGIALDDSDILLRKIKTALDNADILITTGGVSMGEMDLITDVLIKDLGAMLCFGRVNMKPGMPTKFFIVPGNGEHTKHKFVFALPGNPVSAAVTCHLFVLPALKKMCGVKNHEPPFIQVQLSSDVKLSERYEFARAKLNWIKDEHPIHSNFPTAVLTGNQISSRLMNMTDADCLLHLPSSNGSTFNVLQAGTSVLAQLLNIR